MTLFELFQQVPGRVVLLTPDLAVAAVTDGYLAAVVKSRQEVLSGAPRELFGEACVASLERVRVSLQPEELDVAGYPSVPASPANVTVLNKPVLSADGAVEYLIHRVGQTRAAGALVSSGDDHERLTERFLESLVEHIPNMIFVKDAKELRFVRFNKAGEALLGIPRTALIGKNDFDLFPEEQARFFTANDRAVLESGALLDIPDEPLSTKRGVRRLHTRKIPLYDDHGKAEYLLGISEDITEKLQQEEDRRLLTREQNAREQAQEVARHFAHLADAIPQLVFTLDTRSGSTYLNARMKAYLGEGDDVAQGRWAAFIHPADLARGTRNLKDALAQGREYNDQLRVRRADGQYRWMLARAIPFRSPAGEVVSWFGTCTDVDEQVQLSEELERAIAARDDFLSLASHELKTPLSSLRLQLDLARRRLTQERLFETRTSAEHFFDTSVRQVHRLTRLVADLLDTSSIASGRLRLVPERVKLLELTEEIAERYQAAVAEAGSTLRVEGDGEVQGQWDRFRLEQVIANLVTNALKYAPGTPIIATVSRELELAVLTVADKGPGIPKERQPKLFERYERATDSNVSGLGLGLFIVKGIVEAHGGTVRIDSEPGNGTKISLRLPCEHADG